MNTFLFPKSNYRLRTPGICDLWNLIQNSNPDFQSSCVCVCVLLYDASLLRECHSWDTSHQNRASAGWIVISDPTCIITGMAGLWDKTVTGKDNLNSTATTLIRIVSGKLLKVVCGIQYFHTFGEIIQYGFTLFILPT